MLPPQIFSFQGPLRETALSVRYLNWITFSWKVLYHNYKLSFTLHIEVAQADLVENLFVIFCPERWVSGQQYIHDYTNTPDVTLLVVIYFLNHFGSQVKRCASNACNSRGRVNFSCCSKINKLYLPLIVKKDIFWFDVSVDYVHWVTVIYRPQNLFNNLCSLLFREWIFGFDLVVNLWE